MLISDAKNYFRAAHAAGRLAHAYIIVGPPRGEAADFATFAMQLVTCREPGAPCGRCDSCRQIASRVFADAFWLRPMKKSRIISVDQMREGPPGKQNDFDPPYFLPWLHETSMLGGWKFGIVESADRLHNAAANALLKTLEEPPPETLIMLLTDSPQALLPTIVSRCESIALATPPQELEGKYFTPLTDLLLSMDESGPFAANAYAQRILAILAEMRADAESEADAESDASEEEGLDIDSAERDARVTSLYRQKRALLVQTLQRWLRDTMAVAAAGPGAPLHYPQFAEAAAKRAANVTLADALAGVEAIENLSVQLEERNMPDSAVFPYWLDRINFGVKAK